MYTGYKYGGFALAQSLWGNYTVRPTVSTIGAEKQRQAAGLDPC